MNCEQFTNTLDAYFADELSVSQARAFQAHAASCPACAQQEAEYRAMLAELAALDEEVDPPPELMEGVMAQVRGQKKRGKLTWRSFTAMAACLALLLCAGIFAAAFGAKSTSPQLASYSNTAGSLNRGAGSASASAPTAAPAGMDMLMAKEEVADGAPAPMPSGAPASMETGAEMDAGSGTRAAQEGAEPAYGLKIIREASVEMSSENFDQDREAVTQLIEEKGGYITSQELYGQPLAANPESGGRNLSLTIRVPSQRLDEFLSASEDVGIITYSGVNETDVTDQYVDTDRRLQGYQTQYDRILAMMDKAQTVEELISIESELTRINYEIESLTGTLNYLDSRVNYSTVRLSLREVDRTQPVNPTLWERMQSALADTLDALVQGSRNLAVWLFGALPYLAVLALLGLIVWICVAAGRRKRNGS